jgi:hypothetical protein
MMRIFKKGWIKIVSSNDLKEGTRIISGWGNEETSAQNSSGGQKKSGRMGPPPLF